MTTTDTVLERLDPHHRRILAMMLGRCREPYIAAAIGVSVHGLKYHKGVIRDRCPELAGLTEILICAGQEGLDPEYPG